MRLKLMALGLVMVSVLLPGAASRLTMIATATGIGSGLMTAAH
jgi:hypothetical protein